MQEASFRGVPFLFDSSTRDGGRKMVVYEFPNRDKRTVTDLGLLRPSYKLKGTIKDASTNYINNRNALVKALEQEGSGVLVHPMDGSVTVFAKPFTLTENVSELGYPVFDMEFVATSDPIFPTTADKVSSDQVFTIIDTTIISFIGDDTNDGIFQEQWQDLSNDKNAIDSVNNAVNDITQQFYDSLSDVGSNIESITEVKQAIDEISIPSNLFSATDISSSVVNAFSTLFNNVNNARDQASVMASFNGFLSGSRSSVLNNNTSWRVAADINIGLLNQIVGIISYSYNLAASTQLVFDTEFDILDKRNSLNEQFKFIIDNNFYYPANSYSRLPLVTGETLSSLQQAKVLTDTYLRQLDNTTDKTETITVTRKSLINLVYGLYGNLDNIDKIVALNNIGDPTNITGEIKVIAQ